MKIRHTGSVKSKLADARRALGLAATGFEEFRESAEVLYRTKVADARGYFNGVLDAVLDITQAQMRQGAERLAAADILAGIIDRQEARDRAVKSYQNAIDHRVSILDDIQRHERDRCGVGGARGTGWGVLNAVTEHADHRTWGRKVGTQDERDSRRLESILAGERDGMKQVAYRQVLALAN
jgi:Domain of unknown function (DUF932)